MCYIAAAVAVGLGLGGARFLGTLMDRYQLYFILASVGFVGWWLVRSARAAGMGGRNPRRVLGGLGRQVALMGGAYVATLALTVPLSMLVNN